MSIVSNALSSAHRLLNEYREDCERDEYLALADDMTDVLHQLEKAQIHVNRIERRGVSLGLGNDGSLYLAFPTSAESGTFLESLGLKFPFPLHSFGNFENAVKIQDPFEPCKAFKSN